MTGLAFYFPCLAGPISRLKTINDVTCSSSSQAEPGFFFFFGSGWCEEVKGQILSPLQLQVRGEPKAAPGLIKHESSPLPETRQDAREADAPSPQDRRGENREAELFGSGGRGRAFGLRSPQY